MVTQSSGARGEYAVAPSQIPKRGWWEILLRVKDEVSADNLSIVAAGVAFYGFLSLVPALGAFVLIFGLLSEPAAVERQLAPLQDIVPEAAFSIVMDQLRAITAKTEGELGFGLLLSLLLALWGVTKGTKALMIALNVAYEEREKRGFFWQNALALLFSLGAIVFFMVSLLVIAAVPAFIELTQMSGIVATAVTWLRWLVMAVLLIVALAVLYRFAPNRRQARWQWVTPGALLAAALWLVGSLAFSFYVANFGNYNDTFGSLAAVVILLFWLHLSAFSICLGAELNAELEHHTHRDSTIGPSRASGSRGAYVADHTASRTEKE